ncbi:hypothetical protein [Luteimonas sp. 9C]|uniref:hypothetical protein n=1 Tax=Luteimonas sp. 9C TaxID=2653148 RepID=UPI001F46CBD0|nr:hypothetical protein [Luteimonas sp. 9C]
MNESYFGLITEQEELRAFDAAISYRSFSSEQEACSQLRESDMIEIEVKDVGKGRFEVEALGRHHEAFEGRFGAICAAHALAEEALRMGEQVRVVLPADVDWEIRLGNSTSD